MKRHFLHPRNTLLIISIIAFSAVLFWYFLIKPHPPEKVTVARTFHIIAHRGASAYAPENTLAAFTKAVDLGADILELDVHQTKDSQIVVMHDATIDRTTNGKGSIKDFSSKELRQFDAGSWFSKSFSDQKIPLLREVIDGTPGSIKLLIELKSGSQVYPGIERNVVRLLHETHAESRVILKSFDDDALDTLRTIAPNIPRLKIIVTHIPYLRLIIERGVRFGNILEDSVQYLQHHWFGLTKNFIDEAHLHGYGIYVWDVNNEDRMKELIQMGIDGIETDYPDKLGAILSGH